MTEEIRPHIDEDLMIEDTGDRIYLGVPRKTGDKIARIIAMWDVTDYTQEAREQVIRVAEAIVYARRMVQWAVDQAIPAIKVAADTLGRQNARVSKEVWDDSYPAVKALRDAYAEYPDKNGKEG
jgi:hypothetical protein